MTIPITAKYEIEIVSPGDNREYTSYTIQREITRYLSHSGLTPTTSTITGKIPGTRIIGKFELKRGQKITAAIGQQLRPGFNGKGGSGGSFLVLETDKEPELLLAAGGVGHLGSIQNYLTKIKDYFRWGGGGGFTGLGDGSFSADPNAKFDYHYVEYGYCEIKRINE